MPSSSLLFDLQHAYIGEVAAKNGKFDGFILSPLGERKLGEYVNEFQTRGVPMMRETVKKDKDGTTYVLYEDRVQMRDADFVLAFRHWTRMNGIRMVDIKHKEQVLPCWELMLKLPLTPIERFSMLYALCRLPPEEVASWKKALEDARDAAEQARA